MQIELIETFLDLCETRSFNQSAERLGVTQSTVSGRIRTLEANVGRQLFRRSRAGTALTTEGLRFEPHARSLMHSWVKALTATRDAGMAGVSMRIGLQQDLISLDIDLLIANLRAALPDTIFYVEADYSVQMRSDLAAGTQDIAVLYSPIAHPDLHYATLGEIRYVMVSTDVTECAKIAPERYILANYAPAFAQSHAAQLPHLTNAPLIVGQNTAMIDMLTSMGGTGYVLQQAAARLVSDGPCALVQDAPVITQPSVIGVHLRNRHRPVYRQLARVIQAHFTARSNVPRQRRTGGVPVTPGL
ncbi:LysR family transcriptional regulator [Yoonia sp. 2307UL14-13]|uniref:LysR family transcriptional regulator n=1 Tax=Yoonia sp. 2307UL14-13 TaxID=3126506 RepID=UPI0030976DD6